MNWIVYIIIGIIIYYVLANSSMGNLLGGVGGLLGQGANLLNSGANILNQGLGVVNQGINGAADIVNPSSWQTQQANFCCDIYTSNQISDMAKRQILTCNMNCNRGQQQCRIDDATYQNSIVGKPIIRASGFKLEPGIMSCNGLVTNV